jgi:hypothetical protein
MAKLTLNTIGSRYGSIDALNNNSDSIEAAFENTLSRDGTGPNNMEANLDMDSHRVINILDGVNNQDAATVRQVNSIVAAASSGLIASLKERQDAAAGQTVFNLASIEYIPGSNNLAIYIDGVRQYPGESYTETDLNTVTFSAGLNLGAEVLFITNEAVDNANLQASAVQYTPTGTGAVSTTVQTKLRESVSVADYSSPQAAINTASPIIDLVGGSYTITAKLLASVAGQTIRNGTLLFNGPITDRLLNVTASNVTFDNVIFDGNSKQPRSALVYVDATINRPKFLNCTFKNLTCVNNGSTVLNQTYALLINPYAVTNFLVSNCLFKDLVKYNDGVNGTPTAAATVGLGFIGGICFLPEDMSVPTAAQPTPTSGIVEGCTFDNIQTIKAASLSLNDQSGFDDADAIRTYGQTGGADTLSLLVVGCVFRNVSKRAFKFLASESVACDNVIYATGMQYGMITPAYLGNNCAIHNTKVYASAALPVQSGVQYVVSGQTVQRETIVESFYISHCITGYSFSSDAAFSPVTSLTVRNFTANQSSSYGITQTAPLPTTQSLLKFENIKILGSGNNLVGISISGASDATSGCTFTNVDINNGSIDIGGINNNVDGLKITIDNTSFIGLSTFARLFRIGQNGSGGYQNLNNIFINAHNINTAFLNATRTSIILILGDNSNYQNIRIKVPDALTEVYAHYEFYGNSWDLDGFVYDGPGFGYIGQSVASTRWAVKNAVRLGSAASTSAFLYTGNANTGNGLFENITDFRPTTNFTINIANGLGVGNRFIATNVASKTSNATIVQNGGLATVVNAIKFP